ncbi:hypothetical protein IVB56_27170 [Bradyrhizobium sp. CW7]|uniref:hypothetical protein n=1 Tax=Bradyrhizobium sp. CW7 TaxID=2782688 RepID=UPI001FF75D53|nr:hypothetical protein [Bradyrhizobium sp. CW7]MCK1354631.1 hypothetical protein [Bradyrhizobium sp. CW7]
MTRSGNYIYVWATHLTVASFAIVATTGFALSRDFFQNIVHETGSCLSGGCDVVWDVNRRIDAGISSKMENAAKPVEEAFKRAADHLFNANLYPFLKHVETLADKEIRSIQTVFDNAVKTAEKATDNTIDHFRDEIIIKGGEQIELVSEQILQDVKCGVGITFEDAQKFMDENFRLFGSLRDRFANLLDSCGAVDKTNNYTIYIGRKCQLDKQIANAKTIRDLRDAYLTFLELNAKSACAVYNRKEVLRELKSDSDAYAVRFHVWNLALR